SATMACTSAPARSAWPARAAPAPPGNRAGSRPGCRRWSAPAGPASSGRCGGRWPAAPRGRPLERLAAGGVRDRDDLVLDLAYGDDDREHRDVLLLQLAGDGLGVAAVQVDAVSVRDQDDHAVALLTLDQDGLAAAQGPGDLGAVEPDRDVLG